MHKIPLYDADLLTSHALMSTPLYVYGRATIARSRANIRTPSLTRILACCVTATYTLHLVSYYIFLLLFLLYLVVAVHFPRLAPQAFLDLVCMDIYNHYI